MLLDLNLLLHLVPLLSHGYTLFLNIVAFDDFVVPEVANFSFFVLLWLAQVYRHFLEVESAISLVAVSHQLDASLSTLVTLLELEVSNCLRGKVHLNRRFVGLIIKVPNVDSIVLSDEDHTWASGRESTAGILGITSAS